MRPLLTAPVLADRETITHTGARLETSIAVELLADCQAALEDSSPLDLSGDCILLVGDFSLWSL